MKHWIILTSLICLVYSQEKSKTDKFLNIKVQDATAQSKIDALRKEYMEQKKSIDSGYKEKIKLLRNEKNDEIKSLRKSFKELLRDLRKKYKHVRFPKEKGKKKAQARRKRPQAILLSYMYQEWCIERTQRMIMVSVFYTN